MHFITLAMVHNHIRMINFEVPTGVLYIVTDDVHFLSGKSNFNIQLYSYCYALVTTIGGMHSATLCLCSGSAESAGCMEWVSLPCADIPPRNSHAAVLDGETLVIIGGASPEGLADDIFTINLSEGSSLRCREVSCKPDQSRTTEGRNSDSFGAGVPAAREMHSACVYKSKGTEDAGVATILLMGGRSATSVLRDLFSLDTGTEFITVEWAP